MTARSSRGKKACIFIPLILLGVLILLLAVSAFSNLGLPQRSMVVDHLSQLEKARLSEVLNLRKAIGDATWPGWSAADIPIIVYNEKYAFLIDYPDPPDGWKKFPSLELRGGPWEEVPQDAFESEPYYRTPITDPSKTPQGFTVLVGDRWVATFQTREYSQISFYQGFRQNLPPFLSTIVPVRLVWELLMGKTETYIAALEHESFHAYQGMLAPDRLKASEEMYSVLDAYPFDDLESAWKQEMTVLVKSTQAKTDAEAASLARQFLQQRDDRRASMNTDQVQLERIREWEEGLAKYAELDITRRAGSEPGYFPFGGISSDNNFKNYAGQERYWAEQLGEATNVQGISGDTRFYYSGNAIAVLLDRLMPGWKPRALPGGEYLEDLLREAVNA
jgi:hypothetical protein